MIYRLASLCCLVLFCWSCQEDGVLPMTPDNPEPMDETSALEAAFGNQIDPQRLADYANQSVPNYVQRDNTAGNAITDAGATLGRVLFYDKALSADRTISCASCHQQEMAFADAAVASTGVAGTTGRHSMRLVNARFGEEPRFFWDERAATLEAQTTQPIRDHVEMGFSGDDGAPDFLDLIDRLTAIDYYPELFNLAFGSPAVTEDNMQLALAQFIRSLQSFDAKYDAGRAAVDNDNAPFPNFTDAENRGKALFLGNARFDRQGGRIGGGLSCGACHRAPEFSIDDNSRNNGVIAAIGGGTDLEVTRSPSLRDVFGANGTPNGPFMHDGSLATLEEVLNHYNNGIQDNQGLDRRLNPGGQPQRLNLTDAERADVIAFLRTLTGQTLYTEEKWSDPFWD